MTPSTIAEAIWHLSVLPPPGQPFPARKGQRKAPEADTQAIPFQEGRLIHVRRSQASVWQPEHLVSAAPRPQQGHAAQ